MEGISLWDFIMKNWESITVLGVVVGLAAKLTRGYTKIENSIKDIEVKIEKAKEQNDKVDESLGKIAKNIEAQEVRIAKIENTLVSQEKKREEGSNRTQMILNAVTASLKGLIELGTDGPTKKALQELEDFKNKKASS